MINFFSFNSVAGTTGAILTSPLEVVKVRFQADQKSLKRSICSKSGPQLAHHLSTSSNTSSNLTNSSSSIRSHTLASKSSVGGGGGGGGGATSSSHHHTSPHHRHHHPRSSGTKSAATGIRSYVNILFRKNHGTTAHHHHPAPPGPGGHFLPNGFNFELNHHHQSSSSSPFQSFNLERGTAYTAQTQSQIGRSIILKFRSIVENEGFRALYKGLGPNIVGVAPYRYYFCSYISY